MTQPKDAVSYVPNGFTSVTPYFCVADGDAFLDFVKQAFDAEIIDEHRRDTGELWHAAIRLYGSMIEASQGTAEYQPYTTAIHLYVPDCQAVYEKALAAGGESLMPVTEQPYGERSASVKDPCGNFWYIATQMIDMYPAAK